MSKRILITGGAGFIGSHLADELLQHGYRVRALDNLSPQVHGPSQRRPAYLAPEVELIVGDVRDQAAVRRALSGVDAVYHFAAAVGVGQSMYEVVNYTSINNMGTAVLLEALMHHPVERLVVASSMSIYGEGVYQGANGPLQNVPPRALEQMRAGRWELEDQQGRPLTPIPTSESKVAMPTSVYALSKYDQERLCMVVGQAYQIPTVAMRFFNVYGPRQALSNPYTGVLAIFAARLMNNASPLIFEDGNQQRDFVNVHDLARACRLALETPGAAGQVFNVGSGQRITINDVARRIAEVLGREKLKASVTNKYRVGDIRHCFADISHAQRILGYRPQVSFHDGLTELAQWLANQSVINCPGSASEALAARGLVV